MTVSTELDKVNQNYKYLHDRSECHDRHQQPNDSSTCTTKRSEIIAVWYSGTLRPALPAVPKATGVLVTILIHRGVRSLGMSLLHVYTNYSAHNL